MSVARPIAAVPVLAVAVLAAGCLSKPGLECEIARGSERSQVEMGTMGGGGGVKIDCGERSVVGVGFTLSSQNNGVFDEKTATKVSLRCATLSNHDGDHATGAIEDTALVGGFESNIDGPFFADCPGGRVLIGLAAHVVGTNRLFNSLAIDCAALDPSGAPSGDVVRRPVLGTGTRPTDLAGTCMPGQAVHGLEPVSGSELDRIRLTCAPNTCVRPP